MDNRGIVLCGVALSLLSLIYLERERLARLCNCLKLWRSRNDGSTVKNRARAMISEILLIKNPHRSLAHIHSAEQHALEREFKSLNIPFDIHPYFDSSSRTDRNSKGLFVKNILLKDRKCNFYLLFIPEDEELNLKRLKHVLCAHRNLSFASPDEMFDILRVRPGALSPLCMMFQASNNVVRLIIDPSFTYTDQLLNFHPFNETQTLRVSYKQLHLFLNRYHAVVECMQLPYL